ncbi:hypothetical protein Rsub_09086 [Raphidocelis subcapitata]|uniref:Denticleless n=1 Tax=Raphidocelis subcapitata TaxID=307507 RepID=A0A2V0P8V3_9CHLO|nr:hypothetical protein Rsub_09086 [Raphidocelis subcapitata]|eukprot:GBF96291.1 hypothetical protein Rsub_09086 [Raphidocelis subcapitata]
MLGALLDREAGGRAAGAGFARASGGLFQGLSTSGDSAGVIAVDPAGQLCPPFALAYSQVLHSSKLLAVADEEGWVCVVDTAAQQLPSSLHMDAACAPKAQWLAHQNTIYDIAWAKNDSLLLTAAGDHHVGVWDTHTAALRCYCKGHAGSVKAVASHGSQPDVFASGARDGAVLVWDLRAPARWSARRQRSIQDPAARIDAAGGGKAAGPSPGGRTGGGGGGGGNGGGARGGAQPRRSVTSLVFLPNGNSLAAGSDMDGVVRLWDVRMLSRGPSGLLQPLAGHSAPPAGPAAGFPGGVDSVAISTPLGRGGGGGVGAKRGTPSSGGRGSGGKARAGAGDAAQPWLSVVCPHRGRPHGITSLALSRAGDMLLASTSDGAHHLYPTSSLDRAAPWASLAGHRAGSFCVKAAFSPDGRRVVGGSSDGAVHVWDVARPSAPPLKLYGHNAEVTSVAWCPADACQIATASDDATVRVWTLGAARGAAAASHAAAAAASAREARRAEERARGEESSGAAPTPGPTRARRGPAAAPAVSTAARASRAAARERARSGAQPRGGARGLAGGSPATTGGSPATPGSGAPASGARPSTRLRQALITERLVAPPQAQGGQAAAAAGVGAGADAGVAAGTSLQPAAGGGALAGPPFFAAPAAPAASAAAAADADARTGSPPRARPSRLAHNAGAATPLAWGSWSAPRPERLPLQSAEPAGLQLEAPAPGHRGGNAGGCPRHPFGCRCSSNGDEFSVFEDGGAAASRGTGPCAPGGARQAGGGGGGGNGGVGGAGLNRQLSFDSSIVEATAPDQGHEQEQEQEGQQGRQWQGQGQRAEGQPHRLRRSTTFSFSELGRSGSPSRDSWPHAGSDAAPRARAPPARLQLQLQLPASRDGGGGPGAGGPAHTEASHDENAPLGVARRGAAPAAGPAPLLADGPRQPRPALAGLPAAPFAPPPPARRAGRKRAGGEVQPDDGEGSPDQRRQPHGSDAGASGREAGGSSGGGSGGEPSGGAVADGGGGGGGGGSYAEPAAHKRQRKLSDWWLGPGGIDDEGSRFEPF